MATDPYRILSLDGGGFRGLLPAALLARLARAEPGLLDRVDLFAGTSTGAILALGLASGMSPSDAVALYEEDGPEIFACRPVHAVLSAGYATAAKYSNRALRRALERVFGGKTLGDLERRVLVASFDLEAQPPDRSRPRMWKAKFFHNFPGPDSDASERLVDVALRSSAAPVYFPAYQGYIDGGVVATNPGVCALAQVLRAGVAELGELALLSLGTGLNARFIRSESADWGWADWAFRVRPLADPPYDLPLLEVMLEGSVGLVDFQCRQLLGERYFRLDPVLPYPIELDDVGALPELRKVAALEELGPARGWVRRWLLEKGPQQPVAGQPLAAAAVP